MTSYTARKPRRQTPLAETSRFLLVEPFVRVPGLWQGSEGGEPSNYLGTPSLFLLRLSLLLLRRPRRPEEGRERLRWRGPAPSPQGQEARKEAPGAMDGAVMEGPLFLQSQRFGTKVVGGRGCGTPSDLGVGCRAQREGGGGSGLERGPGAEEPYDVPAKLIAHSEGPLASGTPSLVLGRRSCILLGKLRPRPGSCRPEIGLRRRSPAPSPASRSLFLEVEEDLGGTLSCQSPRRSAARVL